MTSCLGRPIPWISIFDIGVWSYKLLARQGSVYTMVQVSCTGQKRKGNMFYKEASASRKSECPQLFYQRNV